MCRSFTAIRISGRFWRMRCSEADSEVWQESENLGAACSTGDEPYSLVMALSRHLPLANIKVIATDIDKQVIDTARMGLYNEKSIASVPDDLKKKYFYQGRQFVSDLG